MDANAVRVSLALPRGDLLLQGRERPDPPREALFRQGTEFVLRKVKPTAVFWGVVDFHPFRQVPCFSRRECLVQRAGAMRVQVVHDQPHLRNPSISTIKQRSNLHLQ